jgi:putative transposase
VRHRFIEAERATYPVAMLCRVMQVSRSGFYTWQRRPPSARALETRQLDVAIKAAFETSKRRSGSPKVAQVLRSQGWQVSDSRVARRMRHLELRSIARRRFRVTTDSKHPYPVAPNRLQRNFTAQRPNQVWVSDLTYLRVGHGWLYLAVFIDLYSRRVVGWALSSSLDHTVVLIALRRAVARRRPAPGLIIHSDRGVQYACSTFVQWVAKRGFVQSMSRKGDCWDNAVAESFFHLLKSKLAHHCHWRDYAVAHRDLFEYIEIFFNRERSHSTLDNMTPDQFEQHTLSKIPA